MAKGYTKNGEEIMDDSRPEMPLGFKRPETLAEQVRRLVRSSISDAARHAGAETFEEADDFDVGDDYDPQSPYEETFDPEQYRTIDRAIKRVKSKKKDKPKEPAVESSPPAEQGESEGGSPPPKK